MLHGLSGAFGALFSVSDILPPMSLRAARAAMVAPGGSPGLRAKSRRRRRLRFVCKRLCRTSVGTQNARVDAHRFFPDVRVAHYARATRLPDRVRGASRSTGEPSLSGASEMMH